MANNNDGFGGKWPKGYSVGKKSLSLKRKFSGRISTAIFRLFKPSDLGQIIIQKANIYI
jgi:hypothetical protein